MSILYALKLLFKLLRCTIVLVAFVTITLKRHVNIPGEGAPTSLNMAAITLYNWLVLHFLATILVPLLSA